MIIGKIVKARKSERMPDIAFKLMNLTFKIIDLLYPYIDKRIKKFGIKKGMTVIDYGCGPGRHTIRFAKIVGEKGKVYAVDILELAIEEVKKKIKKHVFKNIEPILAKGYNNGLPNKTADVICALDMFFGIKKSTKFLTELKRILKDDGVLIIDDGHQSREETKKKISNSKLWKIVEESKDHLKCKPL